MEMPRLIEFPLRTVFCHPSNERLIRECVLSEDIQVLTTRYLAPGHYLASKDIICEPKIETQYDLNDFENNKITIITTHTFK